MSNNFDLRRLFGVEGLVVVATGGDSGIGRMMARALAENGATVYSLDLRSKSLAHSNIHPIICDITSKRDLQNAVDEITLKSGHIDLLICNAGIASLFPPIPPPTKESAISEVRKYFFETLPIEDHTTVFKTNTISVLLSIFAFVGLLDAGNKINVAAGSPKPKSQIVTVGSAGAFARGDGNFIYDGSKAATHAMMKNLATSLVPWDIRCNVIAPGWFHSQITAKFSKEFESAGGVMPKSLVPQERFGSEDEMAGTILYLASAAGGYLNGTVLLVDGGTMAIQPSSY